MLEILGLVFVNQAIYSDENAMCKISKQPLNVKFINSSGFVKKLTFQDQLSFSSRRGG